MAFKGLRFAGLEWKNITASKVMWVVIAAIAIMPLLYGALYLAAFQDPYARLNTVPVAVVNLDEGAVVAGESRNLGNDVVDELKGTDDGLQWNFVSAGEAQQGLEDGTYFMTCTIPADFSASVASADSDAPRKAQLRIEYNQSENMLASQIGESVWKEVRQRVSGTVATEYWETVLNRVADSGTDLQTAADGATTLQDGLVTAQDGSSTITDNLGTLASGADTLQTGLAALTDGALALKDGTSSLASGASQLKDGTGQVASGAAAVQAAAGQLAAGVGTSGDTTAATLYGGANLLAAGVGTPGDRSADTLCGGANQLAAGIGDSGDSYTEGTLYGVVNSEQAAIDAAYAALAADDAATAQQYLAQAQRLAGASVTAAGKLAAGASGLQTAAGQVSVGIDGLRGGIGTVAAGIGTPSDTTAATLYGGANLLAAGAAQVDAGAASAVSGASQLDAGAGQLVSGAQSAQSGSGELASGAVQLGDGSATLTSGLADAVDGSGELAEGLAEGAQTALDQTTNIDGKSDVMSDPVELASEYYTTVKNYGTGFAPYFMALGLWVGCLVAGFVFKPLNNRLIMSGGNPVMVAFANYLPMAVFSLIQATLLMVVLQFGLQLQIDNVPAFYAFGYLTSLVFAAIMQLLAAAFGFPGKFVAIILLMLQLTACAGTFPIQTTPDFFQVINPFMPMTYVVEAMRQIMTGLDYSVVAFDVGVLAALGIGCFALTCLVAYHKRTVRMETLHPVLQLG